MDLSRACFGLCITTPCLRGAKVELLIFSQRRAKSPRRRRTERTGASCVHMDSKHVAALDWYERCFACRNAPGGSALAQGKTVMNFAISRILVPVDFSPHSEHALRYAAAFAGRLDALVEIFHVVEEPAAAGAWGSDVPMPDLSELSRPLDRGSRTPTRSSVSPHHRRLTCPNGSDGSHGPARANDCGTREDRGRRPHRHGNTRSRGEPPAHGQRDGTRRAVCTLSSADRARSRNARGDRAHIRGRTRGVRARGTHEEIEPLFMEEHAAFGSVLGHHGTSRE